MYDRVYGWSGLNYWQSGDTTTVAHLFQSWYDAEKSVMDSLLRPHNYDSMRSVVQQQIFEVKLPIVTLNFQFAYFDSSSVQDGRLSVINGMLIDNQQASPYLSKQVTIAGIATDNILANKSYALQFGSPLVLNNTSAAIQNIVVSNVTQGTQYTLSAGVPQMVQFTLPGDNIFRFTVNLSGGISYITHQVIHVEDNGSAAYRPMSPTGAYCTPSNEIVESDISFQGYDETQATTSFADYHIYYHTKTTGNDCENVLRKPIIILDGFDPGNGRQYNDIYSKFLKNSDNDALLGDDLRDKGYDVIILNFPKLGERIYGEPGVPDKIVPTFVKINGTSQITAVGFRDGGADYIERNAFLLVKLIQQVNATLAANGSNEKIIVVGPSMGGLISRYALAYMEKKQVDGVPNMDHNCRLWISFDSPQDGANIPWSIQENLRFYGTTGEKILAKEAYESQIRSSAARQMLIEQLDGRNSTSTFHTTFYNNLEANGLTGSDGYPANLRKVTLLNGDGNGVGTYSPGAEILNGVGRKTIFNIKVFELIDNFMPVYNHNIRMVKEKVTVVDFLPTFITHEISLTNTNSRGSMDAVPGSTYNSTEEVYTQFKAALDKEDVTQTWSTKKFYHCFIPSISALGFKNPSFDWNTRVDDRNLVCNNEIYFDNYYIPTVNQEHIYLNTDNVRWLTEEIDKGQSDCPTICSFGITGNTGVLCINNNYTYNLDIPVPSGATTHWTTTSNLEIVSSSNNSVTVKPVTSSSSYGSITANIFNPCGANTILTKSNLQISVTRITGTYNSPTHNKEIMVPMGHWDLTTFNAACIAFETNISVPSGTTIQWLGPTGGDVYWSQSGNNVFCSFTEVGQTIVLSVLATNSCGTSTTNYRFKYTTTTSCGIQPLRVVISPNPAKTNMNVSLVQNHKTSVRQSFQKIRIINKMGSVKQNNQYNAGTKSVSVNISLLPPDVYTIQVFDGNTWYSEQFIKN